MTESETIRIPPRPPSGHKGMFGTVLVVGGCVGPRRMIGGPALAAAAAMRSGCGLCELAMPEPLLDSGLGIVPVATGVPLEVDRDGCLEATADDPAFAAAIERATVIAIGPGLGTGSAVERLVASTVSAASARDTPIVLDADALNAIARAAPEPPWSDGAMVLTPHPGEFRRLADAIGFAEGDAETSAGRTSAAAAFARRVGAIVVLKGHGTVVTDGDRIRIDEVGDVGLATGGSGDVLTGIVAGLAAARIAGGGEDSRSATLAAAMAAVHVHGRSGRRAVERIAAGRPGGVLATDLLHEIPAAIAEAAGSGGGTG